MGSFIHTAPEHLVQKLCQCNLASGKEVMSKHRIWRQGLPRKGGRTESMRASFAVQS